MSAVKVTIGLGDGSSLTSNHRNRINSPATSNSGRETKNTTQSDSRSNSRRSNSNIVQSQDSGSPKTFPDTPESASDVTSQPPVKNVIDVTALHEQINDVLQRGETSAHRTCELCIDLDSCATLRCVQCQKNYCGKCMTKHNRAKSFLTHDSVKISEQLFCTTHAKTPSVYYCTDCRHGYCDVCKGRHAGHSTEEIRQVALSSRATLRKYIQGQRKVKLDPDLATKLQNRINELNGREAKFKEGVEQLKNNLHTFLQGLDLISEEYHAQMAAAREKVNNLRRDLNELDASMCRLSEYTSDLLHSGSDAEVVIATPNLPVTPDNCHVMLDLHVPDFSDVNAMIRTAESWIKSCTLNFKPEPVEARILLAESSHAQAPSYGPVTSLSDVVQTYKIKEWTGSLLLDKEPGHVVLRTDDKRGPIKKYDYHGNLVASVGQGVPGLTTEKWIRGLALDTQRGLYVAACRDKLTLLDRAGRDVGHIPLEGDLRGVTYLTQDDLYVVTDCESHCCYVINPRTKTLVRQFGKKGGGQSEFREPRFVTSYVDKKRARSVIAVSDNGNHQIKMFDVRGHYLRSYGRLGHGDAEMFYPWGVCVDSGGQVHVCDLSNSRVVCYWAEGGRERWRCTLTKEQLGKSPCFLDIDQGSGVMAISNGSDTNLYHIS